MENADGWSYGGSGDGHGTMTYSVYAVLENVRLQSICDDLGIPFSGEIVLKFSGLKSQRASETGM